MPTYFVRRKSALNSDPKPEIWHDVKSAPSTGLEDKPYITEEHIVTDEHMAQFEAESSGFARGSVSLLDWCNAKWPKPVEAD